MKRITLQVSLILAAIMGCNPCMSWTRHPESPSRPLVDFDGDYRTPPPNAPIMAKGFGERAFSAVWNVKHSSACQTQFGVNLSLDAYDILANPLASNTTGDVMALFSNMNFGLYPHIVKGKFVNGGLPQLVNMTAHLEKVKTDIVTKISDPIFSGLAVIDWEYWSPVWELNSKVYRSESMALVYRRHPEWSPAKITAVAKSEFEQAARALYEDSLKLARGLRPGGLWGFYGFPHCGNKNDVEHCAGKLLDANNQLSWLFNSSGALYPSIYLRFHTYSKGATEKFVNTILDEAFRVREKSRNPTIPVYSYCGLNYSHTAFELNLEDLNNTILLSAERGLSGVVIWSDLNQTRNREACLDLQRYIKSALGPLVLQITQASSWCSTSLCHDHGRCTGKILECKQLMGRLAPHMSSKGTNGKKSGVQNSSVCQCQCYAGWKGSDCNIAA